MATRDPFDGMTGDELDPQTAESDQLMALGMHEVSEGDEDKLEEEEDKEAAETADGVVAVVVVDPSDDLDKDGLKELDEMEARLLEEEPILDFTMGDGDEE